MLRMLEASNGRNTWCIRSVSHRPGYKESNNSLTHASAARTLQAVITFLFGEFSNQLSD